MEIIATQKFLTMSPRKIRPVVDVIKKLKPTEAVEKLPFMAKRAAEPLAKVIKQAIANARSRGLSDTELTFKEIQIGEGPRLKRGRPVSRGQWHPVKKRMSHIRVVLEAKTAPEKPKAKSQKVKEEHGTKD
ncbi:50S ribosomal protein L22 [Candidatus Woesebacteria bacterium RBG_19FT_COMBO_47_8]|uniref:Large ribosomal subunit protein uL22 n=1 Tax=Candidatus Woesebacteria bacterium RBG_13_46_13 TaxID=1802479 RepID=A0A1F7X7H9_9BACT|nr:MAG: 50S ribosomal protein L22 [Candidatus Woesebacteria bacterium RBG_13_46_13]OGM16754.1 MAG: 50S ribosomal protein L22 [Candidatus Woesebacteria bacterium RBG_19FT_COMBO_47_8]HJX59162.1 50S ribosomal protein L22 [Patescibacteria group bacterium]